MLHLSMLSHNICGQPTATTHNMKKTKLKFGVDERVCESSKISIAYDQSNGNLAT